MVYLDNSATTPLAPEVARRMEEWRATEFANASSIHRGGQQARVALEEARDVIAGRLGARPREVIFTSGGTEANNLALKGYAFRVRSDRGEWPTIVTSRVEHHAILHPADYLAQLGVPVAYVDVGPDGSVDPTALEQVLASLPPGPPPLVSLMHVNNESGAINPIAELARVTRAAGGIYHSDAVQSFGRFPLSLGEEGPGMLTISAHKIHGPKGIGALVARREIELDPLIHGGAQERNRRGGTEPVELAVGFAEAVRCSGSEEDRLRVVELSGHLRDLLAPIDGLRFVSPPERGSPWIVSVTFEDAGRLDGEGLIVGMDLEGVAVSNGSACTSGSLQPSHVLTAMGYPESQAKGAVRFSLSRHTTAEEIGQGARALRRVLGRMRGQGDS